MIYNKLISLGVKTDLAIDIATVLFGDRPLGLLHISVEETDNLQNYLSSEGVCFRKSRNLAKVYDNDSGQYILFDVKSSSGYNHDIDEIWFSKRNIDQNDMEEYIRNTGYYLGYPECCVSSYLSNSLFSKSFDSYIVANKARSYLLNRFSMLFDQSRLMLDYLPCSLGCGNSISLAEKLLPTVKRALGEFEFQSRIDKNRKYFGVMNGVLLKFERLYVAGNRARANITDIRKKIDYSFALHLEDFEIGILVFDYNYLEVSKLKELEIVHNNKSSVFCVKPI